jgi:hypothetical protein
MPVLSKDQAHALKGRLTDGLAYDFNEMDGKPLIDFILNGYILSGVEGEVFDRRPEHS